MGSGLLPAACAVLLEGAVRGAVSARADRRTVAAVSAATASALARLLGGQQDCAPGSAQQHAAPSELAHGAASNSKQQKDRKRKRKKNKAKRNQYGPEPPPKPLVTPRYVPPHGGAGEPPAAPSAVTAQRPDPSLSSVTGPPQSEPAPRTDPWDDGRVTRALEAVAALGRAGSASAEQHGGASSASGAGVDDDMGVVVGGPPPKDIIQAILEARDAVHAAHGIVYNVPSS